MTVTITLYKTDLHHLQHGFQIPGTTLVIEVSQSVTIASELVSEASLPDANFFATVKVPFSEDDLNTDWRNVLLEYWDVGSDSWRLAVLGNTQDSPGHPGSKEGDRFVDEGSVIPTLSTDLGDHGVFWNPDTKKGFAWANVDHATDFAAVLLLGDF